MDAAAAATESYTVVDTRPSFIGLLALGLRLGCIGFGGPLAQIRMLEREVVEKNYWLSQEDFTKELKACATLPGPEAITTLLKIANDHKGIFVALLVALAALLPGLFLLALLSLGYAVGIDYTLFDSKTMLILFIGVQPAVAAYLLYGWLHVAKRLLIRSSLILAGLVGLVTSLIGVPLPMAVIFAGLVEALFSHPRRRLFLPLLMAVIIGFVYLHLHVIEASDAPKYGTHHAISLPEQEWIEEGVKAALFSFGGAFPVLAFLKDSAVHTHGWTNAHSFADGVALLSLTPAPMQGISAFIGVVTTTPGAAALFVASVMAPWLLLVLILIRCSKKIAARPRLHRFFEGMAAGGLGLFTAVVAETFIISIPYPLMGLIFLLALMALYRSDSPWILPKIILASSLVGLIYA